MHRARFTQAGYDKLKKDYEALKASRPAAVEDLKKAREMGDLSENGYYKASRAKLSSIDGRLMRMSYDIKTAKIIEETAAGTAGIGKTVTLKNADRELTYAFVGDFEADPSQKKLSLLSPFGKAVEGKKEGDTVTIETPSGSVQYTIAKVV